MVLDFGLFEKAVKLQGDSGYNVDVGSTGVLQVGGEVTFPSAQSVNATLVGTSEVNIASQTAAIDVSATTVPISVAGTVTVDASGATVPISHTGDMDVNVTNGSLTMTGEVTFPSAQSVTFTNSEIDVGQTGNWTITDVGEITLQRERWNQTGSVIFNLVTDEDDDGASIFTCTAGKDGYIKSITISCAENRAATSYFYLKDGGSGGVERFRTNFADQDIHAESAYDGWTVTFNFPVPLYFGTDIYVVMQGTYDYDLSIQGWEETT